MKKKIVLLIGLIFLVGVGIGIYFIADKNSDSTHEHEYKMTVVEPTCIEDGYTLYECKTCNYSYLENIKEALGHNIIIDQKVEPTFTEVGLTEGSHCSVCNQVLIKQEEIAVLQHLTITGDEIMFSSLTASKDIPGGEEVSVIATMNPGFEFIGWYSGDELVSDSLEYEFTMPSSSYTLIAVAEYVDYTLEISSNYLNSGTSSIQEITFNVGENIDLSYEVNPGYTFIGWYRGDELLAEELSFTWNCVPDNTTLEARTALIEYDLTILSSIGGTANITEGKFTVLDEINLTALPDISYDFIGWYENDTLISTDLTYQITDLLENKTLSILFEQGYVSVNVLSGLNGSAFGTTSTLKDSEITVTAIPNDNYRFVGWFINGDLISTEEEFTQVYDVSGEYNLYAMFDTLGIVVTYHLEDGDDGWSEKIIDPETYLAPYSYKEGYIFEGWYLDFNVWEEPLVNTLQHNVDVYAKWSKKTNITEIYRNLKLSYNIELYSRIDLLSEDLSKYIRVYDANNNLINISVTKGENAGYYLLHGDFIEGRSYYVEIISEEVYSLNSQKEFVLSFDREEITDIKYDKNIVLIDFNDIIDETEQGLILYTETIIEPGNIIYCYDSEDGYIKEVESVIVVDNNVYEIVFRNTEVNKEELDFEINYKSNDIDFDLANGEDIGDLEETLEVIYSTVMSSTNVLGFCSMLKELSDADNTYHFEDPIIDKEYVSSLKEIRFKITVTINGVRKDYDGNVIDEILIKAVFEIKNIITLDCDMDYRVYPPKLNNFELTVTSQSSVSFNLDLIYGTQGVDDNYDALEKLFEDYKNTYQEKKELPFDVKSKYEQRVEAYKKTVPIQIRNTPLMIDLTISPFVVINAIGQLDINTSVTVTNACTLGYSKGDFDVFLNSEIESNISVYALAYIHAESGLNIDLELYIKHLKDILSGSVVVEIGPYFEASGALKYDNGLSDLYGYVEAGIVLECYAQVKIIGQKFKTNSERNYIEMDTIGKRYMPLGFVDDCEDYTLKSYSIDIYKELDLEMLIMDLENLVMDSKVLSRSEYKYELENNKYLSINKYNRLVVKLLPSEKTFVKLYVYCGENSVKTFNILIDVHYETVKCISPSEGMLTASKAYAIVGESVVFNFENYSSDKVIDYWVVNGIENKTVANMIILEMQDGGLEVEVVLKDAPETIYIYSASDLEQMRTNPSAIYMLMNDIDFKNETLIELCSYENPFSGIFYGNGYTIRNVVLGAASYNNPDYDIDDWNWYKTIDCFSVFGHVNGGMFYDVHLKNIYAEYVTTYNRSIIFICGAFASMVENSLIEQCSVENVDFKIDIRISNAGIDNKNVELHAGGLIGNANFTHLNNIALTDISIDSFIQSKKGILSSNPIECLVVGGIVANSAGSAIRTNCYVEGQIKASTYGTGGDKNYSCVGGILGAHYDRDDHFINGAPVEFKNCVSDITIEHTGGTLYKSALLNFRYHDDITSAMNRIISCSENIFYVDSSYKPTDSIIDNACESITSSDISSSDFVYSVLNFNPAIWNIADGKLYLK